MDLHQCVLALVYATLRDTLGYTASGLVLATFCATSMRRLRCIAVLSNVAFISYALSAGLLPVLVLHCVLLPTNVIRLLQIETARRTAVDGVAARYLRNVLARALASGGTSNDNTACGNNSVIYGGTGTNAITLIGAPLTVVLP
jgi:hypothetical protein